MKNRNSPAVDNCNPLLKICCHKTIFTSLADDSSLLTGKLSTSIKTFGNQEMSSQIDQTILTDIFPFVKKGLRLANHNIDRLVNKLDQLKLFLDCDTPPLNIYCINETFLTSRTDDSYLNINGYFLLRKDRIHKTLVSQCILAMAYISNADQI